MMSMSIKRNSGEVKIDLTQIKMFVILYVRGVMYEGEIVGELNPKTTNVQELGLYMAGAKKNQKAGEAANE